MTQDRGQPDRGGDGRPGSPMPPTGAAPACASHPRGSGRSSGYGRAKNAFLLRRLAELGPDEQLRAAELVALLEHLLEEP